MSRINVFVSHAHGESELALLLKMRLIDDFIGLVDVFVSSDYKSIEAGKDWFQTLLACLESADVHVVLCSQNSINSPWLNIELGVAVCRRCEIIPVCHTDLTFSDFRARPLSDHQGLNASDPEGLKFLYGKLADKLGSSIPKADFAHICTEIQNVEKRYRRLKETKAESAVCPAPESALRPLPNPRVLCIMSLQFREAARDDLELILKAFPDPTHHEYVTDVAKLRLLLASRRFDIIHVENQTCPITGDLIFSSSPSDRLPAAHFVSLVKESGAVMVVLANNETLPLFAKLLPVASVVFAEEPIDLKTLIPWVETFYNRLAQGYPPAEACRKTYVQHQIPMKLYPRLVMASDHTPDTAAVPASA